MRITELTMAGFKGIAGSVTEPLSGLDLFTGGTGTGKSTRLEAVQVAMLGHLPRAGKTNADTWGLKCIHIPASARMAAGIQTDGGSVGSIFTSSGKSVSEQIKIDGKARATAEGKALRKTMVGDFPVMFNLSGFLSMSAAKKLDFLAGLDGGEAPPLEDLRGELACGIVRELKGVDVGAVAKAAGMSATELARKMIAELEEEQADEINVQLQEKLPACLGADTYVGGLQDWYAQIHEALLGMRKKLKERKAELKALVIPDTYVAPEEFARLTAEQETLEESISDTEQRLGAAREAARQFSEREKQIATKKTRLMEIEKELGRPVVIPPVDAEGIIALNSRIEALRLEIEGMDTTRALIRDHFQAVIDGSCPVCGRDSDDDLVNRIGKDLRDTADEITAKRAKLDALYEEEKEWSDLLKAAAIRDTEKDDVDKLRQEITDLEAGSLEIEDSTLLESTLAGYAERKRVVGEKLQEFQEAQAKVRQRAEAEAWIARVEESELALAAVDKVARTTIHDTLKTSIGGLIEVSDTLLPEGWKFHAGFDSGKRASFEMGVDFGEGVIPFDALSGGQTVVAACALMAGLLKLKNPVLKVLLVEAAELDRPHAQMLLDALEKSAGDIDNIMVATCHGVAPGAAWSVHDMGQS